MYKYGKTTQDVGRSTLELLLEPEPLLFTLLTN